jgi:phage antirepressor YoqD-like protein
MKDIRMTNENMKAPHARSNLLELRLIEGEPRIRDLDLAERLAFEKPDKIRELIARHRAALEELGVFSAVEETTGTKGGRPGTAHYLNRKQAIFITAKSATPKATDITIEIVERFDSYERGAAHPGAPGINMRNPSQLAAAALQLIEINRELQERVDHDGAVIAILTPRAQFADEIAQRQGELSVDETAKLLLQWSGNKLFSWLRNAGWIDRREGTNTPRMWVLEKRLMVVRAITLRDGSLYSQPMITPRGLETLRHHIRKGDLFLPAAVALRILPGPGSTDGSGGRAGP